MTGPVAPRFLTTTRPPPTELLAIKYFEPLVAPTPVGTRLPRPSETADTINGFLRVEAGGGVCRPDQILWDVSIILHAYAPNTMEATAEQLIADALSWGSNAQGTTTVMDNGDQWYVQYSRVSALQIRKADPMVPLTRYRAMVTWRMPGLPVIPNITGMRTELIETPADTGQTRPGASAPGAPRPSRKAPTRRRF